MTTSTNPMVTIDQITKAFGDVVAVDDVSLDIRPNEFFALLGPSGCGKTTLLRMIAGFEAPNGGRLTIDGEEMTTVPPNRRPVNMVFQSYAVFPHMTVSPTTSPMGSWSPAFPRPRSARVSRKHWRWCVSPASARENRISCPADSASAWRSPAR